MSFDPSAAATGMSPQTLHMGYGASLTDAGQFDHSLAVAAQSPPAADPAHTAPRPDSIQPALKSVFSALEGVNGEAAQIAQSANAAQSSGSSMTPGEMVMLTMRCQQFMFHCQLTSNIANRTSDGLQQLFRQQG